MYHRLNAPHVKVLQDPCITTNKNFSKMCGNASRKFRPSRKFLKNKNINLKKKLKITENNKRGPPGWIHRPRKLANGG